MADLKVGLYTNASESSVDGGKKARASGGAPFTESRFSPAGGHRRYAGTARSES
jgi:hypothetical protein